MRQACRLTAGALAAVLAAPYAAGAQVPARTQAAYTPIVRCPPAARLTIGDRVFDQSRGAIVQRCRGAGGWTVFVIDDDPRSWLALQKAGSLFPLDREMVDSFNLGQFPNVAGSRVLEWRMDGQGRARALIVRVAFQRIDGPSGGGGASASTLMVFDLRELPPRLMGTRPNNAEARALAAEAER